MVFHKSSEGENMGEFSQVVREFCQHDWLQILVKFQKKKCKLQPQNSQRNVDNSDIYDWQLEFCLVYVSSLHSESVREFGVVLDQ